MAEKTLNTRIQQKHDIEANWLKAVNFIPKVGEVIVYDIDETHTTPRMKIGDGVKNINELEFIGEKAAAPNWSASEGEPGYIENRTHYDEIRLEEVIAPITLPCTMSFVDMCYYSDYNASVAGSNPIGGQTYKVIFNGDEYTCVCSYNNGQMGIGYGYNDEQAPFSFYWADSGYISVETKEQFPEITLSVLAVTTIRHKLTEEWVSIRPTQNMIRDQLVSNDNPTGGGNIYLITNNKSRLDPQLNSITLSHHGGAYGPYSATLGGDSLAEGEGSVAVGGIARALADASFATSGGYVDVTGVCSAALNNSSAAGRDQLTIGKNNIKDTNSDYVFIVGNSDDYNVRSNAHTLDWSGNGWFAGGLKVGGTGQDDTAAVSVLTENDMTAITNAEIDVLFQ